MRKRYKKSPRILQKTISILLLSIIFLTGSGLLYLFGPWAKKSEAAWFDDNWGYRKSIAITAHTAAENYVYVNLTGAAALDTSTAGRFQSDCGDLRFTDRYGQLLPYYIVSGCGTSNTVIHVNIDSFPAGAQTLYYYYGNPTAVNGFSSFDFLRAAANVTIGSVGSEEQAPSPIAYWKFDEGTGTVANDSTSNSNRATLVNMDNPASTRSGWVREDLCISGKCMKFPGGTSGSVTVANTISGVKTISFWVRPASSSAALISLNANDASVIATAGSLSAPNLTTPNFYVNGTPSATFTANVWQYVTVTTSTAVTASLIKIGNVKGDYLSGFIDDVKLYNFVRSPAQILLDYNSKAAAFNKGSGAVMGANDQSNLVNGLVGYWKMDEAGWAGTSGEVADSSGNGNNGTGKNSVTTTGGFFARGGNFDGTNDYLDMGTSDSLDPLNQYTLSAWVKFNTFADWNYYIISRGTNSGASGFFGLATWGYGFQTDQRIFCPSSLQSYPGLIGNTSITLGQWHHLVCTWDGTTAYGYLDGKLDGTYSAVGPLTSLSATTQIGRLGGGGASDYYVPGIIDEVRIYNRVMQADEVSELYNWAPGPVLYYPFEEKNGATTNDRSTSGYTGTISTPVWTSGKIGAALAMDGIGSQISTGTMTNAYSSAVTVEAWVKHTTTADWDDIISGGCGDLLFAFDTTSSLTWGGQCNSPFTRITYSTSIDGAWHHVAGTYNGSTAILYVDGIAVASSAKSGSFTPTALFVGSSGGGEYFTGKLDEVRIYNYARTAKQVVQDMNVGHPAGGSPVGSTVAYWKLDEGAGNVASSSAYTAQPLGLYNMASPGTSTSGWNLNGKFAKALGFDGNNDYAAVTGNPTAFQLTSSLSLSAWIKLNNTSSSHAIIAKNGGAGSRGYRLYTDTNGKLNLEVSSNGTTTFSVTGNTTLAKDTWYHVAGVASAGASLTLYVNGEQDGLNSGSVPTSINNTTANLNVGAENAGSTNRMEGFIDEVKVYSGALALSDIIIDYNRGSSLVLGASSTASNSAAQAYCPPGDTTASCAPVGEWLFEDGSGLAARDTSGNSNTGSITNGNGGFMRGKIGKGYLFDAASTVVNVGSPTSLDNLPAAGMTLEAWIYPKSMGEGSAGFIIAKNVGTSVNTGWILQFAGTNALTFTVDGSTDLVRTTSNSVINLNQWNHITVSWDGVITTATSVHIYVNGIETSYATSTNGASRVDDGTSNFFIGNDSTSARTFDGIIDQVRAYNYARNASQVAWDYNYGGPVGWWKFDDCQGTSARDSSGYNLPATITIGGTGTYTTTGTCIDGSASSAWYAGRSGKYNYALGFDGTNDYANTASSANFSLTSFTLSVWVYFPTSVPGGWNAIMAHNSTGGDFYGLWKSGNSSTFHFRWSAGANPTSDFRTTIIANTWYHVVGVYNATTTTATMYVNGMLDTTVTSATAPTAASDSMYFGTKDATNDMFTGLIDDARVYSYPLSADQVKTLYNYGAVRFGPLTGAP